MPGSPDVQEMHGKARMVQTMVDRRINERIEQRLPRALARVVAIPFVVGSPDTPLTVGTWGVVRLELNRDLRLLAVSMYSKLSGSCVIDILRVTAGSYPTAVSLCAAAKPTLAGFESTDDVLTGWTIDLFDRDAIEFHVDSASTVEVVSLTLRALVLDDQKI